MSSSRNRSDYIAHNQTLLTAPINRAPLTGILSQKFAQGSVSVLPPKDEVLEEQKEIYKNVLKFPGNTDYIKYFEKNPHPDRFQDWLFDQTRVFSESDLNIPLIQRKIEFDICKRYLDTNLTEMDRKLLQLPDHIQELIDKAKSDEERIYLTHLQHSFYNWFTNPADGSVLPDVQWINYHFATNGYRQAQEALADLKKNLFNDKARQNLAKKLFEAGAFGNEKREFYFWNTDPRNWPKVSYQARPVAYSALSDIFHGVDIDKFLPKNAFTLITNLLTWSLPAQYKALGDFTIDAIPEGYVLPKGNNNYDICVNRMYFFVNDSFNFEGNQPLGIWNLKPEGHEDFLTPPITPLANFDFQSFARRHNYGGKFPVLSRLHEMEGFQPYCWRHTLGQ